MVRVWRVSSPRWPRHHTLRGGGLSIIWKSMASQSGVGGDLLESLQGRCLQVTGGIDEGEQRDDGGKLVD